jgi:hypothetical protein
MSGKGKSQKLLGVRERTTLRFVYFGTLNPTTGAIETDTYRANGPYDPDYAAGGGQPYGFDQLAAFFERYTVLNCKAKLTAWSQESDGSGIGNGVVFILLSGDASAPTTLGDAIGQIGSANWRPIGAQNSAYGVATVTKNFNSRSFFSVPDPVGNGQIGGLYNGTPDLQAFFHIGYGCSNAAIDPALISYCIELEYDTVWYGRRQVTSS